MTKIDIISGFLGAGKTTLIKKLLSEALKGEQVVLIENEFGEIGIDGGFLKDSGIEIREMNSGCICCSLVGDFGTSLKEVITTYHPDRIIIEPSGVGKLSDVIKAVKGVDVDCEISLNSYTTVADVNKCKMYMRNFGEFFENQLQYARTIILSRTDTPKATEEKVAKAVALIREVNKDAVIITTPIEKLDGAQILEAMEQGREEDEDFCPVCGGHHDHDHEHEHHHHDHDGECGCDHDHEHEHHHHDHDGECGCGHDHHHEGHHHADDVFSSWGTETPNKYDKETLEDILKKLANTEEYGKILRSKGMLPCTDGTWMYFDLVPGEYEIRDGKADFTGRICVIGAELKEDALKTLFEIA